MESGVHGHFVFKIEETPYSEYNPNEMHVRLLNWSKVPVSEQSEEHVSFDLKELDQLPYDLVTIHTQLTVNQLELTLSQITNIPQNRLLILLRHEPMSFSGSPRVELLNMDWARNKKLSELKSRFEHGMMVYVEEGSLTEKKFEELDWYQAIVFNEHILKLHIYYNSEQSIDIKINRNATLLHLKDKIASIIGLPSSEFIVKRKHVVREMKELQLKLVELGITNGALLEIIRGKAHVEGKYELVVCFVRLL